MSDEQKLFPWNEGLPTKPDVDLLLKAWPDPKIGDRFTYQEVESLLKIERTEPRFRTVTAQWRKRLHERGLVVECEIGVAFFVANAEQVSAATYGTLRFIGRKARRHRSKLAVTRPETSEQRATIEHHARLMNGIERDAKSARKNLLPSTITPAPPRIAPPKREESGPR